MKLRFDHINVTVSDLEESIQWYGRLFGFALVESGTYANGHRWAIIAFEDSMICMTEFKDLREPIETKLAHHQIMHFGVRIQDRESWLQAIEKNQLRDGFLEEVEYPVSTSWYLRDPSGHKLEVSHSAREQLIFPS